RLVQDQVIDTGTAQVGAERRAGGAAANDDDFGVEGTFLGKNSGAGFRGLDLARGRFRRRRLHRGRTRRALDVVAPGEMEQFEDLRPQLQEGATVAMSRPFEGD